MAFTVTDFVSVAIPLPQASVNVVVALIVAIWLPERLFEPLQPFEATHALALVELQVSVEVAPTCTVRGDALSATVGAGGGGTTTGITFTVTDSVVVPFAFLHESEYVVVAFTVTDCEPESDLVPLHPFDAIHDVALSESQLRSELPPAVTTIGSAVIDTSGAF